MESLSDLGQEIGGAGFTGLGQGGKPRDLEGAVERGDLVGYLDLFTRHAVVVADGLGDLGEIAHPLGRDGSRARGGHARCGSVGCLHTQPALDELAFEMLGQRGHAVVIEVGGRGAEDGHVLPSASEVTPVAQDLAGYIAKGIEGSPAIELVDGDDVGVVEHVDLLELGGSSELRRHDVERDVGEIGDRVVALPDAGSFDDDEVIAGQRAGAHRYRQVGGHRTLAARGDGAEEHPVVCSGVHADPVAEQSATAP